MIKKITIAALLLSLTPLIECKPFGLPKNDNTVEVIVKNGTPRLMVYGRETTPVMFFLNGRATKEGRKIITEEVEKAFDAGVTLYSTVGGANRLRPELHETLLASNLDLILNSAPEAYIIPRIFLNYNSDAALKYGDGFSQDDVVTTVDGRKGNISIASDRWFEHAKGMLENLTRFLYTHPVYSKRVIGIHLECGEWFHTGGGIDFRQDGLDISPVADRKFREWLKKKYKTDAALRAAWDNYSITLNTAGVPRDLPGNTHAVTEKRTLMLARADQRFADYHGFISDLTVDRILGFSRIVKDVTERKRLTVAFYGYLFELADPQSGHYALTRLLASPDIDCLAGPTSYGDRSSLPPKYPLGATSAFMSPATTVMNAGKLWWTESDQRTFMNSGKTDFLPPLKSINDINEVHSKEMGILAVFRTATWIMDLWSLGWYNDEKVWKHVAGLNRAFTPYLQHSGKPRYDVALVVDEKSQYYVAQPHHEVRQAVYYLRYCLYRAGVSFGLYTLDDVLKGGADEAKFYIFVNPFAIDDRVPSLMNTLRGKKALYMYGFGRTSPARVKELTGFTITPVASAAKDLSIVIEANDNASALGIARGDAMGSASQAGGAKGRAVDVHYVISAGAQEVFGAYRGGSDAAFGVSGNGSFFYGSTRMNYQTLAKILKYAGVHRYVPPGPVFVSDGTMAVVQTSKEKLLAGSGGGTRKLSLPEAGDVWDYFENKWYTGTSSVDVTMKDNSTKIFFMGDRSEIEAMNIPEFGHTLINRPD